MGVVGHKTGIPRSYWCGCNSSRLPTTTHHPWPPKAKVGMGQVLKKG